MFKMNMDVQDEYGWTALHYASREGQLEAVQFLLKKGANIEIKNNKGETPFDIVKKNFLKFLRINIFLNVSVF